ncbi:MAG: MucB/RseB C-terminal domain-containing protein [Rhodoferax sp.]|uniref:MucB/RseB C-terminal domain-containing protein n=1 Tax=Rhodoferax sp. TaxID=50421 RepID=UPI0026391250|nr:MucB/RseB C-terminal domain-containing protein [Rhodoferax sp.]MDD5333098.1 MucB/RseB C-terminal domain-containing protein [Rhodoferax sp.]
MRLPEAFASKLFVGFALGALTVVLSPSVRAQARSSAGAGAVIDGTLADRSVNQWLVRMHEASRRRAYVGTFVVSAGGNLSSSRIWHVCDGEQQMERVESLTGAPRSTFRLNDQVMTFLSESRVVVAEKRESLAPFPNFLQSNEASVAEFYLVKAFGTERVAGFQADVLQLRPKDNLRFGYRVWTEKKTGLVVKLQTLDADGQVLEQAAFSELQLDAPVSMLNLTQMMAKTDGYQLEKPEIVKTVAAGEGWVLRNAVPGFKPMSCYKRAVAATGEARHENTLQWIFSDGLASVSLFVESFDPRRHGQPGALAIGATHTLTRRMGDWWLTVIGEVPAQTLLAFAQGLERIK